jgi:hypothetical protein
MLDNYSYKYALRICNNYCFSVTTFVARTPLIDTLNVLCPSCCIYDIGLPSDTKKQNYGNSIALIIPLKLRAGLCKCNIRVCRVRTMESTGQRDVTFPCRHGRKQCWEIQFVHIRLCLCYDIDRIN